MTDRKLTQKELRDLYRDDFVTYFQGASYTRERLVRLMPLVDLGSGMSVLDIGCGDGLLMGVIHDRVASYHGVDFSSEIIDEAKKAQEEEGIENAEFHAESVVAYCEAREASFDRAFAMDFTEHIYDEDLLPMLDAVRRSLKPGGRLYVHTPNLTFFLEWMKGNGILSQLHGHIAVRNAAQYTALLKEAGFQDVNVRYVSHYNPIMTPIHILSYLPIVGKYFQARLLLDCGV